MRIILLGGPGSGKGTQAKLLSKRYNVPHISTGQLLRDEVANTTKLGKQVKTMMSTGELLPDEIVMQVLDQRIRKSDTRRGFLLDGYPRNIPQAQELDSRLGLLGRPLQIALLLQVDSEKLIKRITGRLTCNQCGTTYHDQDYPPAEKDICDSCGKRALKRRNDDNEPAVRTRLDAYHEETEPLIAFYRAQHKLRTIQADGDIETIKDKMVDIINTEIRPLEMGFDDIIPEQSTPAERLTVIEGGKVTKIKPKPRTRKPVRKTAEPLAVTPKTTTTSEDAAVTKGKRKAKPGRKSTSVKTASDIQSSKKKTKKSTQKAATTKSKTASRASTKATKKTAAKVAKKAATKTKRVAKKATKKKVAKKKITKKVTKTASQSASKKKSTKKKSSKTTKKSTSQTTRKKTTHSSSKLTKRKVSKKVAKKAAKKVTKKASKKISKTAARKSGTTRKKARKR